MHRRETCRQPRFVSAANSLPSFWFFWSLVFLSTCGASQLVNNSLLNSFSLTIKNKLKGAKQHVHIAVDWVNYPLGRPSRRYYRDSSLVVRKGARERKEEEARLTACRQRLLLPLSLPLSHCPFLLPFCMGRDGRGTNVIHSPARRSRSLRPNGQLCKSTMPCHGPTP